MSSNYSRKSNIENYTSRRINSEGVLNICVIDYLSKALFYDIFGISTPKLEYAFKNLALGCFEKNIIRTKNLNIKILHKNASLIIKVSSNFLANFSKDNLNDAYFHKNWAEVFTSYKNIKEKKVLKSSGYYVPGYLDGIILCQKTSTRDFLKKNYNKVKVLPLELDVLNVLIHLTFNEVKNDGILYFNVDDFLDFRQKTKLPSKSYRGGYHKKQREQIKSAICALNNENIINVVEYLPSHFYGALSPKIIKNIELKTKINSKLLNYDPVRQNWHKAIGQFLTDYAAKKNKRTFQIQISRLLNEIENKSTFMNLIKIREKFEDVLCTLIEEGIIKSWDYKNIDEDFLLCCKNWFYYWKMLPVKISL